jgi:hypothetical protein
MVGRPVLIVPKGVRRGVHSGCSRRCDAGSKDLAPPAGLRGRIPSQRGARARDVRGLGGLAARPPEATVDRPTSSASPSSSCDPGGFRGVSFELGIAGGTLVTASGRRRANVYMAGGKIAAICTEQESADRRIDAPQAGGEIQRLFEAEALDRIGVEAQVHGMLLWIVRRPFQSGSASMPNRWRRRTWLDSAIGNSRSPATACLRTGSSVASGRSIVRPRAADSYTARTASRI